MTESLKALFEIREKELKKKESSLNRARELHAQAAEEKNKAQSAFEAGEYEEYIALQDSSNDLLDKASYIERIVSEKYAGGKIPGISVDAIAAAWKKELKDINADIAEAEAKYIEAAKKLSLELKPLLNLFNEANALRRKVAELLPEDKRANALTWGYGLPELRFRDNTSINIHDYLNLNQILAETDELKQLTDNQRPKSFTF